MSVLKTLVIKTLDSVLKRRGAGSYLLYVAARRILWGYNNEDVDIATNGERVFLQRMAARGLTTVFDVGANVGDWVAEVLTFSKTATVYCYEAIPTTYAVLSANIHDDRAHLINKALSNAPGELEFNASNLTEVSSVYDVHRFDENLTVTKVTVAAATGDAEAARFGIDHIDLLKVDTEGHDLTVLRGFEGILRRGAIDVIQFEYNIFTLLAREGLFDFYEFLGDRFFLCRLLPNGLELMAYERGLDNFSQSNWICVRKDLLTAALVKQLNIILPQGHRRAHTLASLATTPAVAKLLA